MSANDDNQQLDNELLARLMTDRQLSELPFIPWKANSIKAMRSRGDWPFNTYRIGKQPCTDIAEVEEAIAASCIAPSNESV